MTCDELSAAIDATNDPAEKAELQAQWDAQCALGGIGDHGDDISGGHGPTVPPHP